MSDGAEALEADLSPRSFYGVNGAEEAVISSGCCCPQEKFKQIADDLKMFFRLLVRRTREFRGPTSSSAGSKSK